jgi:hypothetical protein
VLGSRRGTAYPSFGSARAVHLFGTPVVSTATAAGFRAGPRVEFLFGDDVHAPRFAGTFRTRSCFGGFLERARTDAPRMDGGIDGFGRRYRRLFPGYSDRIPNPMSVTG